MPDALHGKALFEGLLDYPLPKTARDYVFYGPDLKGFGTSARKFFGRFYPNHAVRSVSSLEELIGRLHTDVTQQGVQRIREIVIVAHGTSLGLVLPLLTSTDDLNLKVLTAYSMALLQDQMWHGAHADLRAKRAAVVTHLHADSWVTVRACNFGQSEAGMYGLYSFFGGNADVYAPKLFQFFGDQPIVEGMRFPSRLAVHAHQVRQRYLPNDVHTPDRQDAIVRALADPGAFGEPFPLSTESLGGGELPEYGALIDSLNAGEISVFVKGKFHDHGFDLTDGPKGAKVIVELHDGPWTIHDSVAHPDASTTFAIEYRVGEQVDFGAGKRAITAQASLPETRSAQDTVPLQLFFDLADEDAYKGVSLKLAWSRDDDDSTDENKVRFDAVRALLESNGASGQTFSSGQIDLRTDFDNSGLKLADSATITLISPPTTDPLAKKEWAVGPGVDGTTYLVKLEHPYVQLSEQEKVIGVSATRAHTLNVFPKLGAVAQLRAKDEVVARSGIDVDCPGVELAASMDRLSIDDLVDLITYLRAPYRVRNVVQLWHAVQAVTRKGNYPAWFPAQYPDGDVFPSHPLNDLSIGEREDKRAMVYDVEFQRVWAEVKASTRTPFAFQHDLFYKEESLADRFGIPPSELGNRDPLALEGDSPYSDAAELRRLEALGFNQYLAVTQKLEFAPPPPTVDCNGFRAAAMKLKDLTNAPVEQLAEALAGEKTETGTSYLKIILDLRSKYAFLRNFQMLTELSKYLKLPKIIDPTSPYDVAKTVAKYVAKYGKFELAAALLKDLGKWDMVITIPLKMWLHVLNEQQAGVDHFIAVGKITAVRAWLRGLIDLTFEHESDFPDEPVIDLTTGATQTESYYMAAYSRERDEFEGVSGRPPKRFILFDEDLKKGFDEGAASMGKTWPVILRYVQQVTADVLRETNLASCQVQALIDAGFLDLSKLKATIVREFARRLLSELDYG